MTYRFRSCRAFSLVEVTLALGIAAFCLIAVLGLVPAGLKTQQASIGETQANSIISQVVGKLRAATRVPPGQEDKTDSKWILRPHTSGTWDPTPDTLFFTADARSEGSSLTANSVFRATIHYIQPPTDTTSLSVITVSWPAPIDPSAGGVPSGSVSTFAAINR